jgi:hypothetical protein
VDVLGWEHGLAKRRVSVWLYDDRLNIEYRQIFLARYDCQLNRQEKSLAFVSQPTLYQTRFASPQLELFELDDEQWRKVWERLPYMRRKSSGPFGKQLPFFIRLGIGSFAFPLWTLNYVYAQKRRF